VLVFAYDGSLNGDWVAHYAARFAANAPERRLRLVHVHETQPVPELQERIARIAAECEVLGVALETDLVAPGAPDVAARLLERVPQGATLIAGTRARQRHSMLLAGTVAERLLEAGRFPVIAIRVVHPGVLGQPGNVLLPLAARSPSAAHALFVLRLLGADLQRLHVLLVRALPRLRHRLLGGEGARRGLAEGRAFLAPVEEALRAGLAPHRFELDSSVVASDDASRDVLLYAARYRSRLICLDASERAWSSRLFHGDPIERVLRDAPSDVAVYRSLD
jgi:nucleotide-binding universal stress UspA family protein